MLVLVFCCHGVVRETAYSNLFDEPLYWTLTHVAGKFFFSSLAIPRPLDSTLDWRTVLRRTRHARERFFLPARLIIT
jgi:hypothetical protein